MLSRMLSRRLEVDHECEMAYELLRLKWTTPTLLWKNTSGLRKKRSVETEFPAIDFNDGLTLSCEPTASSPNDDEIDFGISNDESDDDDYTLIFDKNSFSYKIISANDLKMDSKNDNEKVNMPLFPSPEPMDLKKEISTNIGGEFTNLEILKCWSLETSRRLFNTNSCSKYLHGESTEQLSGEFLILILFNSRI
ncbi:hypothetical protein Tco_0073828 [Tanacetum coccineum]